MTWLRVVRVSELSAEVRAGFEWLADVAWRRGQHAWSVALRSELAAAPRTPVVEGDDTRQEDPGPEKRFEDFAAELAEQEDDTSHTETNAYKPFEGDLDRLERFVRERGAGKTIGLSLIAEVRRLRAEQDGPDPDDNFLAAALAEVRQLRDERNIERAVRDVSDAEVGALRVHLSRVVSERDEARAEADRNRVSYTEYTRAVDQEEDLRQMVARLERELAEALASRDRWQAACDDDAAGDLPNLRHLFAEPSIFTDPSPVREWGRRRNRGRSTIETFASREAAEAVDCSCCTLVSRVPGGEWETAQ